MSWSNQCLICLITKLISVALLQFITHVLVSDKYSNKKNKKIDIWNRIRLQFWNLIRFSLNFGFIYIQCIVFLSNILLSIFLYYVYVYVYFKLHKEASWLFFYILVSFYTICNFIMCETLKATTLGACIVSTLNLLTGRHIVEEKSRIPLKWRDC